MSLLDQELVDAVLALVDSIPSGRVATYGQIARLIGRPKKCPLGGKDSQSIGTLWRYTSLPSGSQCSRAPRTRLGRPDTLALGGGSGPEG